MIVWWIPSLLGDLALDDKNAGRITLMSKRLQETTQAAQAAAVAAVALAAALQPSHHTGRTINSHCRLFSSK